MAKQTKQKKGVSVRKSSEILALYQKAGVSRKTFCSTFKQYSSAVSYRHAIKPIGQKAPFPTKKGTILGHSSFSIVDKITKDILKFSPFNSSVQF